MTSSPLKLGFLASKNGTSMRVIVDAARAGALPAEPRLVVSNNRKAAALEFAAERGVPSLLIPTQSDPAAADAALCEALEAAGVELVILSGYLRHLGPRTLGRYRNRILNIHPSLIPSFCGPGYYGLKVHEEALKRGVKVTGATVHFVNEVCDGGPILLQKAVEVQPGDTPEVLQKRVMVEAEWKLLPQAIAMVCNGEA